MAFASDLQYNMSLNRISLCSLFQRLAFWGLNCCYRSRCYINGLDW